MASLKQNQTTMEVYPVLIYFQFAHLPPNLQAVSRPFNQLAWKMARELPMCEETDVVLRKLLEAKDAAVRSALNLTPHI